MKGVICVEWHDLRMEDSHIIDRYFLNFLKIKQFKYFLTVIFKYSLTVISFVNKI